MPAQVIEEALERFRFAQEAEQEWRRQCLDDLRFAAGEIDGESTQWAPSDLSQRKQQLRPALTINRCEQFTNQVTNEARLNNPSIRISPVDDGADIETAEILQGIVRHIEVASFADICRATARENMVTCGVGYTRFVTEFADDRSFDLEVRFGPPILNPFSVYMDPSAIESDRSDAQFAFITHQITEEQHRKLYPNAELSNMVDYAGVGDIARAWLGKGGVRIADYYCVEAKTRKLVAALIGDSQVIVAFADELDTMLGKGRYEIQRERDVEIPEVYHRKINGLEVLGETIWPGRFIPVVQYAGRESLIDGHHSIKGLVRTAKPAQKMYNFWVTALSEMIAASPKAPYLTPVRAMSGLEQHWDAANAMNRPYLPYNDIDENGMPVAPPTRQPFEPPIQAITQAIMQADRDMKATFGIYEAGLGQRGPQESGKAIQARKQESDVATYHLIDNESRARRLEGKQLLDLIQRNYDTERVMRIIGMDETPSTIRINSQEPVKYKNVERIFDIRVGKYDVVVDTGPGFATKRQQAAEQLQGLVSAFPDIMTVAGDLIVKAQDVPYAQEIAERIKPQSAEEEQQIPPAAQQKLAEMDQMIQALTQQLEEKTREIEAKTVEAESRERIAAADNETRRYIAELQAQLKEMEIASDEKIELLKAEMASIKAKMDLQRAEDDREFQREAGEAERGIKMEMAMAKATEKQETT